MKQGQPLFRFVSRLFSFIYILYINVICCCFFVFSIIVFGVNSKCTGTRRVKTKVATHFSESRRHPVSPPH